MPNQPRVSAVQLGALLAAFVLAVFLAALGLVLYIKDITETERVQGDYRLCLQSKVNRDAIRAAITAGDPTNLMPGEYGYSYAHTHPAEAQRAHDELVAGKASALAQFPEIKCPMPR